MMVEMSRSSLLVERKSTYSQVLQNNTKENSSMTKDSSHYLNGDISFFGRQERSNSECSSDSQLDTLLEAADKIKDGKHEKIEKPKKRVHFNMDKNEEFTYSYSNYNGSLDEESGKSSSDSLNNINFVGFEYMNGNDSSDDDDDDGDEDEDDDDEDEDDEDEEDTDENEYDTETSEEGNDHGLGKYGFLVDKSSEKVKEINNNTDNYDGETTSILTGKTSDSVELSHSNNDAPKDVSFLDHNNKTITASQINHLEMALKSRKAEIEKEMSDLSERLKKVREGTISQMEGLEKELRKRRAEYSTEIEEISRHREEQKQKFEEELEEFQNEKKLEERRKRYYEHERIITEKEDELDRRKRQAVEQEREVRDYEEYLNRRHKACNNKEEDLTVLQNELETLARELEAQKERLLNKSRVYQKQLESVEEPAPPPPDIPMRTRSPSRASTASRGVDWRINELKSQNKNLLEELFTLKKALESKDEEIDDIRQTMGVLESENKRLLQKVKNLESQLELARKSAELSSDSPNSPVEEILRKTATDLRKSRVSRVSRVNLEPLSLASSHSPLSRTISNESVQSKAKSSNSSDSGKEEKSLRSSSKSGSKNSDDKNVIRKGSEKTTSSLCTVM